MQAWDEGGGISFFTLQLLICLHFRVLRNNQSFLCKRAFLFLAKREGKTEEATGVGSAGICESGQKRKSIPSSGNSRSKDMKVEKLLGYLGDVSSALLQEAEGDLGCGVVKMSRNGELKQPSSKVSYAPQGQRAMGTWDGHCRLGAGETAGRGWGAVVGQEVSAVVQPGLCLTIN